jgi:hypothetical protein
VCSLWAYRHSQDKLQSSQAQHLANTINALGKLGHRPEPGFIMAFVDAVRLRLADFEPQGLSNLCNGLARLEIKVS